MATKSDLPIAPVLGDTSSQARARNTRTRIATKTAISLFALMVLLLKLGNKVPVDPTALGLIALIFLPWMSDLLDTAELPGGWKVKFRAVEAEQERLGSEVRWLKFLMRNFLTQYELGHLRRFADPEPFWYDYHSDTKSYFERELRRMLDLRVIDRLHGKSVKGLLHEPDGLIQHNGQSLKDVKQFLRITQSGLDFLRMHQELGDLEGPG